MNRRIINLISITRGFYEHAARTESNPYHSYLRSELENGVPILYNKFMPLVLQIKIKLKPFFSSPCLKTTGTGHAMKLNVKRCRTEENKAFARSPLTDLWNLILQDKMMVTNFDGFKREWGSAGDGEQVSQRVAVLKILYYF